MNDYKINKYFHLSKKVIMEHNLHQLDLRGEM